MEAKNQYVSRLKEHLNRRQRQNPHYSLRAFARDLDLHPSTLSAVLKGKRPLPLKDARKVAKKLLLSPVEETLFIESLFSSKSKLDEISIPQDQVRFMLDESHYKVLSEWEHFAVLSLFDIKGFKAEEKEIAKRLGISERRAESVLSHLLACGLLKQDDQGNLIRIHQQLRTTEDIQSQAIHQGHREALEVGLKKLEEISVEMRDFSEVVLAVDMDQLPDAKTIIREFRKKMSALMKNGNHTEVYQLAIQFYPMTQVNKLNQSLNQKGKLK
jgi:uncharacterized protein (TIGR02147 family)